MLLTDEDVMSTLDIGRHNDGGGLYLHVRSPAARSWILFVTDKGKRREIALGSAAGPGKPGLSLADARDRAQQKRDLHASGELFKPPPVAPPEVWTFRRVADTWFTDKYSKEADAKTVKNMRSLMDRRAARLMPMDVRAITSDDVEAVLSPIWETTNRSAHDLRIKLETILGFAAAKKYREPATPNPADWKILQHLLPDVTPHVEHHAAVPYKELPAVMRKLRAKNHTSARALDFATLTAVRTAECRGARWQEIDFDETGEDGSEKPIDQRLPVWTIPAERMKVKKITGKDGKRKPTSDHRVALSRQAVALLRDIRPENAQPAHLIFPGEKAGEMMGHNAMAHTLQRITAATPHGMRSAFSTWREEKAPQFDYRLAEAALAHSYKGEVEGAYNRSDLLEKRRPLMQAWADFLDSGA